MENKRRRPVNVGMASLFAVLIVLCLVIFAVLSGMTAKSELALAQKAADSLSAYYAAEYRAVEKLAGISESGSFTEEIDENRELRVVYRIADDRIVIDEWAVAVKETEKPEQTLGVLKEGQLPWE